MSPKPASAPSRRSLALLTAALILVAVPDPGGAASFVGVSSVRAQWFENSTIPFFPVDPGEHFGAALAAGDFNGDGAMDLATGVPEDSGSTVDPQFEVGAVYVRWGVPGSGLAPGPATTILNAYAQGSQLPVDYSWNYGAALAVGDFNGDGFDDLAVGAHRSRQPQGGGFNRGVVLIHYGLPDGIQLAAEHLLQTGAAGVPNPPGDFDRMGAALAAGDFDGDGYDDLAIGVPQNVDCCSSPGGAVIVVHGHVGGVYPFAGYLLRQGEEGIPDVSEDRDDFGLALAAGNFNGDTRCTDVCRPVDDLAIGVPGEDSEGAVMTVFGSEFGLIFTLSSYLGQFHLGGSSGEADDSFGRALAAGDFDGDGDDELVIGTPFEDLGAGNSAVDAGEITVVSGLSAIPPYFVAAARHRQGTIFGDSAYDQAGDRFGAALAAADFDRDGFEDLAIGIPGEDVGGTNRGGVALLTGGAGGLYTRFRFLAAGIAGIPPGTQDSSDMGAALGAGDFDGDGHPDLAVGLPYRNVGANVDAGAQSILYGALFADGFETGSAGDWSSTAP